MKKILSVALALTMITSLATGCVKTKSDVTGSTTPTTSGTSASTPATDVKTKPEQIRILGQSTSEIQLNIMRDQLAKAGFDVVVNMQPDYSSFMSAQTAGDYDLALTGWTTVTGNPDYAVRSIFITGGDYNRQGVSDPKLDELIEKAATETPAQYAATYKELEEVLVTENAYIVPMFSSLRLTALNNTVIKPESYISPKSRSLPWEMLEYVDASQQATRPLMMTQSNPTLTSLDPIQANDGSVNTLSTNMNVRLVNLTTEDGITAEGSLSHNYAIAAGNKDYYFLLRDDINFSKVENKKVANTGVRVGAEDAVFSLKRAADKNSVADHRTYSLHSSMENIEIVTDLEVLKNTMDSDTGKPIIETLSKDIPGAVASLTADKTKADNKAGSYQVVKVTTKNPFPQVLNYLAHQSAGILCEQQVTSVNSKFDVASYDKSKDICYGDFAYLKSGNHHLWMSGPYALTSVDDYQVTFEKNPGYMVGTKYEPRIQFINYKFIKDTNSATSAFRSGEIDCISVSETDFETLKADPKFTVNQRSSNGVTYATFNLTNNNKFNDKDLRLAVLYAVNQQDYISVYNGLKNPCYSTVSTIVETGNVLTQDLNKSKQHLAAYQAKQA